MFATDPYNRGGTGDCMEGYDRLQSDTTTLYEPTSNPDDDLDFKDSKKTAPDLWRRKDKNHFPKWRRQ